MHHLIALWASQHTNVMHDWLLGSMTPSSERRQSCPLDHGNRGHLRPCRERCLDSGLGKWEKKSHCLNLIIFHWFIEHPLISIHFEAGPFWVKVFFPPFSLLLVSLACSLHFIINWHKPFFEVQEPSWGMTAQQTMNKTQKDNEHCLNIQVSHSRMGRGGKKRSLVLLLLC